MKNLYCALFAVLSFGLVTTVVAEDPPQTTIDARLDASLAWGNAGGQGDTADAAIAEANTSKQNAIAALAAFEAVNGVQQSLRDTLATANTRLAEAVTERDNGDVDLNAGKADYLDAEDAFAFQNWAPAEVFYSTATVLFDWAHEHYVSAWCKADMAKTGYDFVIASCN